MVVVHAGNPFFLAARRALGPSLRRFFPGLRRFFLVCCVAALAVAEPALHAQVQPPDPPAQGAAPVSPVRAAAPQEPPQRALVIEGLASFGNYNLFASGSGCKLWTSGIEYDRHSWGRFLRADVDYVGEVLPFVLLEEPTKSDYHGYPTTTARRLVPGVGFSPIGFRLLWRSGRLLQPYMEEKGGILGFTRKVINANSTYEDFSLQSSSGLLIRTQSRFDLRIGLYSDFHMSNAFMVPTNPGLDVMNANFGLSYDLGGRRGTVR